MNDASDRRKIETIMREPLTLYRLYLNERLKAAQDADNPTPFTLDDLDTFISLIPPVSEKFQDEVLNMKEAILSGEAPRRPYFDTPETQLIWGAALMYLSLNPEAMQLWKEPPAQDAAIGDTGLWQQLTSTKAAYGELLSNAEHIREAMRDKNVKYGWSEPGTGFTYNRRSNTITIDMMQSLIVGFEHARAEIYREIGHSLLSVTYPARMNEIYDEMRPLIRKMQAAQDKKKKGPQLTQDEYKQLRLLSAEWELRHMMFAAAEENTANRFVANIGQQMMQDYSVSLNNTAVTFRLVGLTNPADVAGASPEYVRYINLCNAVQLSFFANNSLFEDSDAGWSQVGVDPALVRKTETLRQRPEGGKEDSDGIGHADFRHLRELCGGPNGLEHLQPKQRERLYGSQNLKTRIDYADQDRKAVIEEIWRLYAEDLIQKILQHTNDEIDQQMKNKQDGQDQDQNQDGQENDQENDQSQDQQGQGKGKGKGKGQKGPKGPRDPNADPSDADGDDDMDGDPQQGQGKGQKKKQQGPKQDGQQDGDPQDADAEASEGDEQDQQAEGDKPGKGKEGDLGADKDENVPVEGLGDMPAPAMPDEKPSDEKDPSAGADADGQDGQNGQDNDADGDDADAKTIRELEQELDDANETEKAEAEAEAEADGEGQDADGQGQKAGKAQGKPGKSNKPGKQAGKGGEGRKLGDLAKQDWTEYQRRIAELQGPISQVRKLFKSIQELQLQRKRRMSKSRDILPENGEVKDRFNIEAHRDMIIKQRSGQLEESDLERFQRDETHEIPTTIDIFIMIDGSWSMNQGSPKPLDSALQASAIMLEAARAPGMNINVYVGIWGSDDPPIIVRPGTDMVQIGQAMQAARTGLSSGTDFAPAISKVAKTIADSTEKGTNLTGLTHVLVISDGDIFDKDPSKKNIETMFSFSDRVTFDVALITPKTQPTEMEKTAKSIHGQKHHQTIGTVISNDPEIIPLAIVGMLLEKVRKSGSFTAEPASKKRQQMKKASNKMGPVK